MQHSDGFGIELRLSFDQLMNTFLVRIVDLRGVPLDEHTLPFSLAQEWKLREALLRIPRNRFENRMKAIHHAADGLGFEQIGVVFEAGGESTVSGNDSAGQVELGRTGVDVL